MRYWTSPRQPQVRQVQTRAIMSIKEALDAADISIPYPIRTLYFYDQDNYNDYLPSQRMSEKLDQKVSQNSNHNRY